MKKLETLFLLVVGTALVACGGGSTSTSPLPQPQSSPTGTPTSIPTPTPTPTPFAGPLSAHVYVSAAKESNVLAYAIPASASATATANFNASDSEGGMAFDANKNLFVASPFARKISVFAQPLTTTSTPSLTFGGFAGGPFGIAFDGAGSLYAEDWDGTNTTIRTFTPPFSGTSLPSTSVLIGKVYATGMATFGNQMAVGTYQGLKFFTLPLSSTSTPATGYSNTSYTSTTYDSSGRLFAGTVSNSIDVFASPVTSSSAPQFSIKNGLGYVYGMAFDSSGTLYVDCSSGVVVYTAPLSASSTPAYTIPIAYTTNRYQSIVVGPGP